MALSFLEQTPEQSLRKIKTDLALVNPQINLNAYEAMTPKQLKDQLKKIKETEEFDRRNSTYGSWLNSENFVERKLLGEAISLICQEKEQSQKTERLIPGEMYYHDVKQFGNIIEGYKVQYSPVQFNESRQMNWIPFKADTRVAKALEVLRFGSEKDFKKIYVECADGRIDALENVSYEHIAESSDDALNQIAEYCDAQWEGPWAWEVTAPQKIINMIEDNREMKKQSITEMKGRFDNLLRVINEGDAEKFEVINLAREMVDKVDGMISDLGTLSSDTIETAAGARSVMGDAVASELENSVREPINQAAQTLSQLKASIEKVVSNMENSSDQPTMNNMGDASGGHEMGGQSPAPANNTLAGKLADVNLDGDDFERPKKAI